MYLQVVRGYSALQAGLYSLPMAVMMLLLAPLSGRIVDSRRSRWPQVFAGVFMTIAPLLLAGVAAAIASTSRQIGFALEQFGPAFATATHPGWAIIAGLELLILVLGALTSTAWALRTARRTASRLALD